MAHTETEQHSSSPKVQQTNQEIRASAAQRHQKHLESRSRLNNLIQESTEHLRLFNKPKRKAQVESCRLLPGPERRRRRNSSTAAAAELDPESRSMLSVTRGATHRLLLLTQQHRVLPDTGELSSDELYKYIYLFLSIRRSAVVLHKLAECRSARLFCARRSRAGIKAEARACVCSRQRELLNVTETKRTLSATGACCHVTSLNVTRAEEKKNSW